MNKIYIDFITDKLSIRAWQVENVIELLEEGATIPFISRYRKERSGGLDEVEVAEIKHLHSYFIELESRKKSILTTIEGQGKLTDQLREEIELTTDSVKLEDLYLPYRPKRRTRATIAKERGLEPLAETILEMEIEDCIEEAEHFLSDEVESVEIALQGARDIIAERVSETIEVREKVREQYLKFGKVSTKESRGMGEEERERSKYKNYFDFSGSIANMPSHRLLALLRGANEGELSLKLEVEEEYSIRAIKREIIGERRGLSPKAIEQVESAIEDSYKRLLHPSIENETLKIAKERADREAVMVFGENLTALLLAAPVGQKRVLAIDPGFRTGSKMVVLNEQGELIHNDTIYPHPPQNDKVTAIKKVSTIIEAYKVEVIAIGDGTASRETEHFIKKIPMPQGIEVYSVSEDGASIYSASDVAREEFPDYDVTVRGAVSIGRRAMDPLAELVKIDPKSLGVGQYQHDVDQNMLKEMLDNTVVSCVNSVGVNLNTASKHLLSYVSGVGASVAQNIVDYRAENGPFRSKKELLKVKRLGPKIFEQSAGFLRIPNGENPLDNTAVHPERYQLVEEIASDLGRSVAQLIGERGAREEIKIEKYISEEVGEPTLKDILEELAKPGLDPRKKARVFEFSQEVYSIEDLKTNMILPGIVTNITNFGAFVDIGIKQDGLIHISQLADRYISNPSEVVKLHQHLKVKVLDIDLKRGRIQLTLKGLN